MSFYSGSVSKALMKLFPDLKLQERGFVFHSRKLVFDLRVINSCVAGYWQNRENRRLFFENFAKDSGFSARDAISWYTVDKEKVLSTKVLHL